jgi:uncharacterized protein (TIGR00288 family)
MTEARDTQSGHQIAMLIDGDNAQPSLLGEMVAETSKYGDITVRRVYGDWTLPAMNGWKAALQNHAFQPFQQFRYTVGKNATDSAMIIDAMDILHTGKVDAFCLVSSDSDYTRLATRIREQGFFVIGIGERKTPQAFVNGCNVFTYTENLVVMQEKPPVRRRGGQPGKRTVASPVPVPVLRRAFDMAEQEDGWALLGTIGQYLRQLDPGFDSRTYGFRQLST